MCTNLTFHSTEWNIEFVKICKDFSFCQYYCKWIGEWNCVITMHILVLTTLHSIQLFEEKLPSFAEDCTLSLSIVVCPRKSKFVQVETIS